MTNTNTNRYPLNEKEIKRAAKIRSQYLEKEDRKVETLKSLDAKVKAPGRAASIAVGSVGALAMGGGMSMVMVGGMMAGGIALGLPGMAVALTGYPIYKYITNKRRKQYAAEVMRMSDEMLQQEAQQPEVQPLMEDGDAK